MPGLYRSILVPVDGTPFAEQALPLALAIARRHHAILHLAMVHQPAPVLVNAMDFPGPGVMVDRDARREEHEYLNDLIERLSAQHRPVSGVLLEGDVTGALETHVRLTLTDLVVTTTHGRGQFARFWMGSVSDHLMRHLEVPVILLRPSPEIPAPESVARVLVALDGSRFAEKALKEAAVIASAFQAGLELLYVVEPPLPIADPSGMVVLPPNPESEQLLLARAGAYLEELAARLRAQGLEVSCVAVAGGRVATSILEQAGKNQAGLIALATHGLGGFRRLLLGSVAEHVVRESSIPVLVTRPGGVRH